MKSLVNAAVQALGLAALRILFAARSGASGWHSTQHQDGISLDCYHCGKNVRIKLKYKAIHIEGHESFK
jgi:hypothetical protein